MSIIGSQITAKIGDKIVTNLQILDKVRDGYRVTNDKYLCMDKEGNLMLIHPDNIIKFPYLCLNSGPPYS